MRESVIVYGEHGPRRSFDSCRTHDTAQRFSITKFLAKRCEFCGIGYICLNPTKRRVGVGGDFGRVIGLSLVDADNIDRRG